jgi:hypothetical protein
MAQPPSWSGDLGCRVGDSLGERAADSVCRIGIGQERDAAGLVNVND